MPGSQSLDLDVIQEVVETLSESLNHICISKPLLVWSGIYNLLKGMQLLRDCNCKPP